MITKNEILDFLRKENEYLSNNFYVTSIGLFGSYAKNEMTDKSDIDILVEFQDGHNNLFNFFDLREYLENSLKKEVDLIYKIGVRQQLKDEIFGSVIYA